MFHEIFECINLASRCNLHDNNVDEWKQAEFKGKIYETLPQHIFFKWDKPKPISLPLLLQSINTKWKVDLQISGVLGLPKFDMIQKSNVQNFCSLLNKNTKCKTKKIRHEMNFSVTSRWLDDNGAVTVGGFQKEQSKPCNNESTQQK